MILTEKKDEEEVEIPYKDREFTDKVDARTALGNQQLPGWFTKPGTYSREEMWKRIRSNVKNIRKMRRRKRRS